MSPREKYIIREKYISKTVHLTAYRWRVHRVPEGLLRLADCAIPRRAIEDWWRQAKERYPKGEVAEVRLEGNPILRDRRAVYGVSRWLRDGRLMLFWDWCYRKGFRPCMTLAVEIVVRVKVRIIRWIQFLYTLLVRCESPVERPYLWRHVEARLIAEAPAKREEEAKDSADRVLTNYLIERGYEYLLPPAPPRLVGCYSGDVVAGYERIEEFEDAEDREFTAYLEIWNYRYDRVDFQDIARGVTSEWVDAPAEILEKIVESYRRPAEHIEERKGVETRLLEDSERKVEEFLLRVEEARERMRGTDGGRPETITSIMSRVNLGLDVDRVKEWKRLQIVLNAQKLPNKIYRTRNGLHLRFGVRTDINLRHLLQDCRGRIYYSLRRMDYPYVDDVLFHAKRKGGKWHREEEIDLENVLALPFWSKIPRGYWRRGKRR